MGHSCQFYLLSSPVFLEFLPLTKVRTLSAEQMCAEIYWSGLSTKVILAFIDINFFSWVWNRRRQSECSFRAVEGNTLMFGKSHLFSSQKHHERKSNSAVLSCFAELRRPRRPSDDDCDWRSGGWGGVDFSADRSRLVVLQESTSTLRSSVPHVHCR